MCGEEHAEARTPRHTWKMLDDIVVIRVDPGSAGVQRRIDGLLHDVKRRTAVAARRTCFLIARSPSHESGGARRDRTDDLKLAKLALSQLSYGPVKGRQW